jgi:uncharacterized protein (TIGR02588 family)
MTNEPEEGDSEGKDPEEAGPPGGLEIVATVISAVLIACLLGVLVWDATHPNTQPAFELSTEALSSSGRAYRVPVHVRNIGDESAKSVVVHVELTEADTTVSETDITVDWLPGRSKRDVVALFGGVRAAGPLAVTTEVRGYAIP